MGLDFTLIAPLLLSHCGFSSVLGRWVSSLVKSRVFLSMIVQQPVVILVLSQEGVRARPSTLPSWLISLLTFCISVVMVVIPPLSFLIFFLFWYSLSFLVSLLMVYQFCLSFQKISSCVHLPFLLFFDLYFIYFLSVLYYFLPSAYYGLCLFFFS